MSQPSPVPAGRPDAIRPDTGQHDTGQPDASRTDSGQHGNGGHDNDRHAWERPGVFEVAPGVHRIPLPLPGDGLRAVNVYAIADGDRLVLIDGGLTLAQSQAQLEAALAGIGHDLRDISRFLVTHAHRDHYTQAVTIRRLLGTRVALGADEAPTLAAVRRWSPSPSWPAGSPRRGRTRRSGPTPMTGSPAASGSPWRRAASWM